jgi:hypothetical protein
LKAFCAQKPVKHFLKYFYRGEQLRLKLVIEPARQTVQEFVLKWLIKDHGWSRDPEFKVKVVFPGEAA